jgi:hypothetical protein
MKPEPPARFLLALIVATGFVLRLVFFSGFALGDDVFYQLQAIAHGLAGAWPPEPYHWETRLAITLPTAALVRVAGLASWVFVIVPLTASTAGIFVAFRIAREFVEERTALLVALFQACYPLELIFSTHLFPDIPVALFQSLSLWFWIRALRSDRPSDFAWAGVYLALGYLCRETVVMAGPAYLALWAFHGRWRRPRLAWSALAPLATVAGEMALYGLTAGDPLYRMHAVTAQQEAPFNLQLAERSSTYGFWIQPFEMLIANQEFGAYQALLLLVLVFAWKRFRQVRVVIVWWLALFLWSFYGTTLPTRYVPMWPDARYASILTIPALIILSRVVASLPARIQVAASAALVASGIAAASLDQGTALLGPHRAFAASTFARDAIMEPSDYYGARWASGLTRDVRFRCATDLGRETVVKLLSSLPGTTCASSSEARYIVFGDRRRLDLLSQFEIRGWKEVAQFSAPAPVGRRAVASVLARLPGQAERASRIAVTPALRVLENPNRVY